MQGWQVALLVITAVFVGLWIPASLQLFATLRSGKKLLETMDSQGEQTLTEMTGATAALKRTIADVGEVAHMVARTEDSIRFVSSIAAAVGPVVIAFARAPRAGGKNRVSSGRPSTAREGALNPNEEREHAMSEQGNNGQATNGRSGYSGTTLFLMFLGGTMTGAGVAYLAQAENRKRIRLAANRARQTADQLPQAVRDASHAAVDAFVEAYSSHGEADAATTPKQDA